MQKTPPEDHQANISKYKLNQTEHQNNTWSLILYMYK